MSPTNSQRDHLALQPLEAHDKTEAGEERMEKVNVLTTDGSLNAQRTTKFMLFFCMWISFASWIANFDAGYQGTVLIMPSFNKAFGTCRKVPNPATGAMEEQCSLSATRQSITGVGVLFQAVGGAAAGVSGTYIGRRTTLQLACAICIIGGAGMLGTAGNFLHYMAVAIVYGAECTPPNRRGLLLGVFNIGLAMGNVAASAVAAGSSHLDPTDNWQWRAPIMCQIPLNLILGIGVLMFPESPRWLAVQNREDQARLSVARFQKEDPQAPIVTAQIEDINRHIELERQIAATTSWTEIYHGRNLVRTLTSCFILISLAVTGIQFVAPYAALFLESVGIKNPYLINVIIGLCILGGALWGSFALEYGGRRFSMLVGYSSLAVCMLIFSSVSTALGAGSEVAKNVVVVFLCLWAFLFGGFIGPSVWLASAEMHSVRLRTYGQANTTFFYNIFSFAATFWTPYMLSAEYGNMGVNVGYFYFGITLVVLVLTFLLVPETARLTLEQIDDHFISGRKAWKTSTARNKRIARGAEEL
ncbi:hypothetical protein LTR72_010911 [Exophiala xenobiotica]|nr:hypothetical protein LTR72_010911 [Exophiala xenobiotica]KAK5244120.1 hypothetical protein LTS06_010242 [Exophiala xenobiotica]KAK5367115.1 hypothetical protein LTS13_007968 [Exophiala xenobiotica]KAK5401357.1 hypothetical protein LTR79_001876 [Exophiala xenobiotica]KAK5407000.1 hypothetical protein LTR90_010257 [Exophiala xenobiotica]